MKSPWLKAAVLAVSMVLCACGGTQEFPEQTAPETDGVQQMLPQCDEEGQCPAGFSCPEGPGSTCRKGRSLSQDVEQLLPQCDDQGRCPTGFYCVGGPFGTCRRGVVEQLLPQCDDQGRCPTGFYCVERSRRHVPQGRDRGLNEVERGVDFRIAVRGVQSTPSFGQTSFMEHASHFGLRAVQV